MQTYFAIVHREAGAAYGVNFPDLPGCFAAADEDVDLFTAAREAVSLFVEDLEAIPRARTIEQLLSDPAVAEEMSLGGVLLAVPVLRSERKARVNVMLEPSLLAGIDQTARAVGLNRSEFIAEAVKDRLLTDVGVAFAEQAPSRRIAGVGSRLGRAKTNSGSSAAKVLKSKTATKAEKSVAASALTQKGSTEATSKKVASSAAKILKDPKASKDAKSAAASALTQKKK